MTVLTKKLTSLRGLIGSRYKSLYERISENQHKNLVGLAHELHNQDRERYKELKPFSNPKFDVKNGKKQLKDCPKTALPKCPNLLDPSHVLYYPNDKGLKNCNETMKKYSLMIDDLGLFILTPFCA